MTCQYFACVGLRKPFEDKLEHSEHLHNPSVNVAHEFEP